MPDGPIVCEQCGRHRKPTDIDYSPVQVVLGRPLGWYSGSDGELCPSCITSLIERANSRR